MMHVHGEGVGFSCQPLCFSQLGRNSLPQETFWYPFLSSSATMADNEAPRRGVKRAAAKADREAEGRRVRQRLDEMETRLEWSESMGRSHEQRVSFQESPQRIFLRGFARVPEFFRTQGGDFKVAKRAFIGGFFHELREKRGAEVTHYLDEAEGLLAERDGWGVLGIYLLGVCGPLPTSPPPP